MSIYIYILLYIYSIAPVEEYIDKQFHQYFQAESGLNRKNIQDSRVHCMLYFISPYGHGYVCITCIITCLSTLLAQGYFIFRTLCFVLRL